MDRGEFRRKAGPALIVLLAACSSVLGIEQRREDSAGNYPASGYDGCRPGGSCSGCLDVHRRECEVRSTCAAAAVSDDCAGCVCQSCTEDVVACQLDEGCSAIWLCLKQSRCDLSAGAGCLQECASIIDAQGGPEGAAFRAAAQVRTCAIASACSSCLASEPAPPASCSRENSCQGCPDCFRECLCSGERFGDCKDLCGEDAPPAACTPENGCVGCTSCFELCACDGGTFEKCTSACQPPEPPPVEPCSAATDCSDCSDCLATCACEGGELAACEAACSPPPANDVCVEAVQSGGEDTCGGCGGCLAECTCRGGSLEECMASNACDVCSQSSGDMAECVCDGSDSADECADDLYSCDDASPCSACACDLCPGKYALCQDTQPCPAVFSCLVETECQGSACRERCGGVASGGSSGPGSGVDAFDVAMALWACHQANHCQCEAAPPPVTRCMGPAGEVECPDYTGTGGTLLACCPAAAGIETGSACGLALQQYFQNARSCEPRDQGRRPRLLEGCPERTIFEPPYNGVKLSGCCHQADSTCGVYDDITGLGCLSSSAFGIQPTACGLL